MDYLLSRWSQLLGISGEGTKQTVAQEINAASIDLLKEEEILKRAIETFGANNQKVKAFEEIGELTSALARNDFPNLAEEIADVRIMLEQLVLIYDCKQRVRQIRQEKLLRLNNMVDSREKKTW